MYFVLRFVGTAVTDNSSSFKGCIVYSGATSVVRLCFHAVNRASPQAAWIGQGDGGQQQAPLSTLLTQKPATAVSKQGASAPEQRASRTPERISRSQPASPARTRRKPSLASTVLQLFLAQMRHALGFHLVSQLFREPAVTQLHICAPETLKPGSCSSQQWKRTSSYLR